MLLTKLLVISGLATLGAAPADDASAEPKPSLPKVLLIGDSIRLGYAPTVIDQLKGKATVFNPSANGGDSQNVIKHLDRWLADQPDIVHFNCGIHDTKRDKKTGVFQVSPGQYETNLRRIVARIRKRPQTKVLFATTTPILDDRAAQARKEAEYDLLQQSVDQYNLIARRVMRELNVPIDDLAASLDDPAHSARVIGADGIHFKPEGSAELGKQVAAFVREHLP